LDDQWRSQGGLGVKTPSLEGREPEEEEVGVSLYAFKGVFMGVYRFNPSNKLSVGCRPTVIKPKNLKIVHDQIQCKNPKI